MRPMLFPVFSFFAIATGACSTAQAATHNDAEAVAAFVARFDAAVSIGFPAALEAPWGAGPGRARRAVPDAFVVTRKLNIGLDFPGGVSGTMYTGSFDGEPATFTRTGDHLDVTVAKADGVDVTGFTVGEPTVEHADRHDPAMPRSEDPGATTHSVQRRSASPSDPSVPVSVPDGHREVQGAHALHFYVFLHDDIRHVPARHIHAQFMSWWLDDLVARVLPVDGVHVSYVDRLPWVTDMAYDRESTLDDFARVMFLLSDATDGTYARTFKHKFVLLTKERPGAGTAGQAYEDGVVAVASISGRYRIVAHEAGHLLGARHADATIQRKDWWWCETNMFPSGFVVRSNCYAFSAANERRMRAYLRVGPTSGLPPSKMSD